MQQGEDSTKNTYNKENDIKDWDSRQKVQWKYSRKETNKKQRCIIILLQS
jgi:hypothetical protein